MTDKEMILVQSLVKSLIFLKFVSWIHLIRKELWKNSNAQPENDDRNIVSADKYTETRLEIYRVFSRKDEICMHANKG